MTTRILFITPIPTHPQNAGHRSRIYQLVKTCHELTLDVHLAYLEGFHQAKDAQLHAMTQEWLGNVYPLPFKETANASNTGKVDIPRYQWEVDDWFDDSVASSLSELYEKLQPDIIFVEYVTMSKALTYYRGNALKIIDCMDVFYDRTQRMQALDIPSGDWYSFSQQDEITALQRADCIVAITHHDASYFRSVVDIPVVTLGHLIETHQAPAYKSDIPTFGLLASGSDSNVYYTQHFLDNAIPMIKEHVPEFRCFIAGNVRRKLTTIDPHFVTHGDIHDLSEFFERILFLVNPESFGTGLSIKSVSSLANAIPLVTTHYGMRGIENAKDHGMFIADTVDEMCSLIINLLKNPSVRDRLSEECSEFATAYRHEQVEALKRILKGIIQR